MPKGTVVTPSMPDPRSGLVLDTHQLSRRAGEVLEVQRVTEAPADLGIGVIGVPLDSPIELDLRLASVGEGVLVTGTAVVHLLGHCARCLIEITSTEVIDVQQLFCYPGKELDDAEANRIEGELIDLEPTLRDEIVLDLPFTPLCRPDCAGLCSVCGANLNTDPGHTHGESIDPRWTQLSDWTVPDEVAKNEE